LAGVMFADFASEPFENMGIFHGFFRHVWKAMLFADLGMGQN
jgi:hypothetical protein